MTEGMMHKQKGTNPACKQAFLTLPFIVAVTSKTDHSVCPPRPAPRKESLLPARDRNENVSLLGQPE